jgi:predicted methyltransferase
MKRISLFVATAALLAASTALAPAATVTAKMKAAVADPARPEAD